MRLMLLFLFLFPLANTLFAQKRKAEKTLVIELSEALSKKMVALHLEGSGGHQGESLRLQCRNLLGRALRVRIPQGQFMEPADSSMQTLVVSEAVSLFVGAKTPGETTLKTFCAQSGDRSPMPGTAFSVGAMAPDNLCHLLRFLSANGKTDSPDAQAAVWCVTNNHSLSSIGDESLVKFLVELLGKKRPGYRIRYESREVPGERAALGKALMVEGNYQFTLDKEEKLSMLLLDASGKLIKTLRKDERAIAGEHRSGLNLQVWNLPPGNYIVRVQTAHGTVIKDLEVAF